MTWCRNSAHRPLCLRHFPTGGGDHGCILFSNISASLFEVPERQIDQFRCRLFGGKQAACLDGFSDHAVQMFNCVGRIDDLSDHRIEGKERDHLDP